MFGNAHRGSSQGLGNFSILLAAVLLAGPVCAGEFKLPAGVYHLGQLAAARDEAAKSGKALAFVLSELKGKAAKAATPNTLYAFAKLKGACVPVYVDYTDDLKALADKQPLVARALHSEQAGKTIPRVVATDPEVQRVLAIVATMPEGTLGDGVYADACKQIQAYLADPTKQAEFDNGKNKKNRSRKNQ